MKQRIWNANIVKTKTQLEKLIESLCDFDFCYKLTEEESKIYQVTPGGYLFPCLRPKDALLALAKPTESIKTIGLLVQVADGNSMSNNFFWRLQVIARFFFL